MKSSATAGRTNPSRSRIWRTRIIQSVLAEVLLAGALGGCSLYSDDSNSSVAREVEQGKLVTIAVRERQGYEVPKSYRNPALQAKAVAHRDQIWAAVKKQVVAAVGRDAKMVEVEAVFPYNAVDVRFITLDEPIVSSAITVGLTPGGLPITGSTRMEQGDIQIATVNALYVLAYRDRLNEITQYLERQYPQYEGLPKGYMESYSFQTPYLTVSFTYDGDGVGNDVDEEVDKIYAAYTANPHRTAAEWRRVFETQAPKLVWHVGATLILKDPSTAPTEQMAKDVVTDMKTNRLFSGFKSWAVMLNGNLIGRDQNDFHETYTIMVSNLEPTWQVIHTIDGETQ